MLDSIALGQLLRRRVLVDVGCEVLKWPSMLFGHRDGMILHAFGVLEQERSQTAAAILIQPIEEFGHGPTGHDGQVAAKDHAVETREYTVNEMLILRLNSFIAQASSRSGL